ncbi:TNFAIP3-interacting protein 1-like [Scomber scombrus]|uniref:TNFAIP3-interacting protein 1-like n=1 Tax=Scomber scombrus TaxID=13677 RepID=UPI002DD9972C|nr:TNFAIP3-interacting protein 1-like [Scomber scombrus]
MKAQILIMEKQKQELLSINERWAKEYRIIVQYYQDKVRDLKALLQHNNFHSKEEETHIALFKKSNVKTVIEEESTQAGNSDVNAEVLRAEREAKELRAHNSTLTRKGLHQQEEIKRLNKALEETFITTKPLAASNETLQDVWKHQAEIYKEDFLKERKDREILKGKCLELEKGLRKAHKEVHVLKSQESLYILLSNSSPQYTERSCLGGSQEQGPPRVANRMPKKLFHLLLCGSYCAAMSSHSAGL